MASLPDGEVRQLPLEVQGQLGSEGVRHLLGLPRGAKLPQSQQQDYYVDPVGLWQHRNNQFDYWRSCDRLWPSLRALQRCSDSLCMLFNHFHSLKGKNLRILRLF